MIDKKIFLVGVMFFISLGIICQIIFIVMLSEHMLSSVAVGVMAINCCAQLKSVYNDMKRV